MQEPSSNPSSAMFLIKIQTKVKTDILHREGFVQEGAFEAACSGVACEARGQERDDAV